MTCEATLLLSLSGPAIEDIVDGLGSLGLLPEPETLRLDNKSSKVTGTWLADALGGATTRLDAQTDHGHNLVWDRSGLVTLRRPGTTVSTGLLDQLGALPFQLAVISGLHLEWYDEDYEKFSFSDGHYPHGWASAVKGAGHQRLVSDRWLDHGPWRTSVRGDATWLEFHDLDADPGTALAQAGPAWERLGISDTGGVIQTGFVFTEDVGGVYDAGERKLEVMVPRGGVTPRKMLEIAAVRRHPRIQDGAIERTAFVFLRADEAQADLDELWLHGHEVWAIVDGEEMRLDADHAVPPPTPDWA